MLIMTANNNVIVIHKTDGAGHCSKVCTPNTSILVRVSILFRRKLISSIQLNQYKYAVSEMRKPWVNSGFGCGRLGEGEGEDGRTNDESTRHKTKHQINYP